MGSRSVEVGVLGLWILLLIWTRTVLAYPLEPGENGSSESSLFSIGTVLLSIGLLICGISLLALCAGGFRHCWPARYLFGGQTETVASFSNPIANSSGGLISEMDVRALELDPIVFEPLPTLTDLTPRTVDHFPLNMSMGRAGAIVPFTSDESSLYAHDWFDEPFRNFPRGNLEYMRVLGKGWFGKIIEAEARDIVPYARKIRVLVKMLREDASGLEQMRFLDESRLYRDGDHGNILKLLGHSIEMTPFLLIMEYCPQGDLKSFLIANVTRADFLNSRGDLIRMALDIGKGLEWMGWADFTHGDLAARNCQVGSEGRVLIGDYGIGTQLFKDDYYWSANVAIPLRWAAPETVHCTINTIQTLKVSKQSNVWTFGVVLWELCEFGKLPYFHLSDDEVISRVLSERTVKLPEPAMPSLLLRKELFDLMTSCWHLDPNQRPSISHVVSLLGGFLADPRFQTNTKDQGSSKDEFERKWEQLGNGMGASLKSPPTPGEAGKKKSVSFKDSTPAVTQTVTLKESAPPAEPILPQSVVLPLKVQTRPDATSSSFSKTQINFENRTESDPFPSLDFWKAADADEVEWNTRIERGDISRKVREKSQSVQDLMILTHVEPGDLSDPESLIFISSKPSSSPPGSDTPLRKASSDTALSSPSKSPSTTSQAPTLNKPASLVLPHIQFTPATPTNKTGIDIQLIPATPKTPIQINVIEPSPNPPAPIKSVLNESPSINDATFTVDKNISRPRRFIFKDEVELEDVGRRRSHGARHTSTPIRSSSSTYVDEDSANLEGVSGASPVFNSPTSGPPSPPFSPISVLATRRVLGDVPQLHPELSSVILGASEEFGLSAYQSVTTVSSDMGDTFSDVSSDTEQLPKPPHPRANFSIDPRDDSSDSILGSSDKVGVGVKRKLNFEAEPSVLTSVLQESSVGQGDGPSHISQTPPNTEEAEFWSEQMQSLHAETGNTLALFQLGLCPDEGSQRKSAKDTFEDDIRATQEEMGSLVLFDLETQVGPSVVKETREFLENGNPVPTGIAFGGQVNTVENKSEEETEETTQVLVWPARGSGEDWRDVEDSSNHNSMTTEEGGDEESLDPAPFVPSKWNSALNPSKPAIKSPESVPETESEVQKRTGIRKSVSFERKRTQLVYEYPPPNPHSDEEEDPSRINPGSLALSLDWELQPDELEAVVGGEEEWEDDVLALPKTHQKPLDMYRISGLSVDESVSGAEEAAGPSSGVVATRLGVLRHTRQGLKLDLWNKGEASMLDDEGRNSVKLDSGVGSSTTNSPFNPMH